MRIGPGFKLDKLTPMTTKVILLKSIKPAMVNQNDESISFGDTLRHNRELREHVQKERA